MNSASVTVLDASFGTEREVHTVRDSDEEVRAIARRLSHAQVMVHASSCAEAYPRQDAAAIAIPT